HQEPGYACRYALLLQSRCARLRLFFPHKRQKPWKPFVGFPTALGTTECRRPNYARPAFLRGSAGFRNSEGKKNYTPRDGGPQFSDQPMLPLHCRTHEMGMINKSHGLEKRV